MRKIVVIVVALAVAGVAWAGASFVVGGRVKSRFEDYTTRLSSEMPALKVTETSYERGLFSSTRTTSYAFGCVPPAPAEGATVGVQFPEGPISLTVRDRIRHGPLAGTRPALAVIESELVLSAEASEKLSKVFGDARPLQVRTVIELGGGFTSTVDSPAVQADLEEGAKLDWKGIQGTVRGGGEGQEVTYDLRMPGFEILDAGKGARVTLTNARLSGTARLTGGSIWLAAGSGEGRVDAIEGSLPASPAGGAAQSFSLRDLRFASDSTVTDGLLGLKTSVSGHGSFAGIDLETLEMEVSLRRVHAASYQKVAAALMGSACDPQARKAPDAALAAVQGDLYELLRHEPEYAVDRIAVEVDGRRGEVSYSLGVQGVTPEDARLPPQALFVTRGRLDAAAKLPVDWVVKAVAVMGAGSKSPLTPEQVRATIVQLAQQGLLVLEGVDVRSSLRYAQGALTVNGVAVPLPGQR